MRTWPFSTTTSPGSTPARSAPDGPTADYSKELNRILSAAVVSRRFRNLLLSDAAAALHSGYNGETFELSEDERTAILAIQAGTLRDFAAQLMDQVSDQERSEYGQYTPRRTETTSGVAHFA